MAPATSAMATITIATAVVPARIVARRLITGDDQPVPGAPNGLDQCTVARTVQLGAESAHVYLDDVGIAVEVEIPDVVQNVALRHHLVGMVQQQASMASFVQVFRLLGVIFLLLLPLILLMKRPRSGGGAMGAH